MPHGLSYAELCAINTCTSTPVHCERKSSESFAVTADVGSSRVNLQHDAQQHIEAVVVAGMDAKAAVGLAQAPTNSPVCRLQDLGCSSPSQEHGDENDRQEEEYASN